MSKLRIPAMALAAMVAASAVVPLAGRADETKTTAAALKHRWTFNTDLKDSVTGYAAQKIGSSVAVADGVVKMTGAGNSQGSLNLGSGIMPPGAATVEIWAKQTAAKNYSRIFDYAQNTQNYLMEAWTAGTDINKSIVEVNRANTKYTPPTPLSARLPSTPNSTSPRGCARTRMVRRPLCGRPAIRQVVRS